MNGEETHMPGGEPMETAVRKARATQEAARQKKAAEEAARNQRKADIQSSVDTLIQSKRVGQGAPIKPGEATNPREYLEQRVTPPTIKKAIEHLKK